MDKYAKIDNCETDYVALLTFLDFLIQADSSIYEDEQALKILSQIFHVFGDTFEISQTVKYFLFRHLYFRISLNLLFEETAVNELLLVEFCQLQPFEGLAGCVEFFQHLGVILYVNFRPFLQLDV